MNLHDFKLWLSGFEAAFEDGCPNAKQYAVLRQKLDEVRLFPEQHMPQFGQYPLPRQPGCEPLPYQVYGPYCNSMPAFEDRQ